MFSPAIENQRDEGAMEAEPSYAEGFLANAYVLLPYQSAPTSDVATDDAVTNDQSNSYLKMATGSWASDNDPMSQWQTRFNAIQYINIFLQHCDKVKWANDEPLRTLFDDQFKGQAYALRAVQQYFLLRAHAGYTADGKLMGYPIHTQPETSSTDFNQSRNTFKECYDQIMADIDSALERLPLEYGDIASDAAVPAKYTKIGATMAEYNRAFGSHFSGMMNGKALEALRAQLSLCSPPARLTTVTATSAGRRLPTTLLRCSTASEASAAWTPQAGNGLTTRPISTTWALRRSRQR
jgi:hypothetical protein